MQVLGCTLIEYPRSQPDLHLNREKLIGVSALSRTIDERSRFPNFCHFAQSEPVL